MKKYIVTFLLTALISSFYQSSVVSAEVQNNWYTYQANAEIHTFSLRFPQGWQAMTTGTYLQGFSPVSMRNEMVFKVREFQGQTYEEAIDFYLDDITEKVSVTDKIWITPTEDLVIKKVVYHNKEKDKNFGMTFMKRGSSIFSLTEPNLEGVEDFPYNKNLNSIVADIYNSFTFSDGWRQFIDFNRQLTFLFPTNMKLNNFHESVEVSTPGRLNSKIFKITTLENTDLASAPELMRTKQEKILSTEQIEFNEFQDASFVTYENLVKQKKLGRIFFENNGTLYVVNHTNLEENFPYKDFYDSYVQEILDSIYFFDIKEGYIPFTHFPDVRDDQPNAVAINSLKEIGIIGGYNDGFFRPDGQVNRAELTKIIVLALRKNPSAYQYGNCFSDVKYEWFAPYVCYAKSNNWIGGFEDGTFRPTATVSRAEALKIVIGALLGEQIAPNEPLKGNPVNDISSGDWFYEYFVFASNRDLLDLQHLSINESTYSYLPNEPITRKEIAEMIYNSGEFINPFK